MARCKGEKYSYEVVRNDAEGAYGNLPWLVVESSNMGDGAFVFAACRTRGSALSVARDAQAVEDAAQRMKSVFHGEG